jgi:hypothetical protein
MTRLAELQKDLQDASAAVAHAERTLAAHPDVPSVMATLRTIQNRRASLEEQFFAAADELGLDVCGYRIEVEGRQASISGLTAVLGSFQKIFTTVYDALERGPKKTSKVSSETINATSFGFAYTFPGSVGIMMTLPNDRLLFESKLDEAMKKTFELIQASEPAEIQVLTEVVGLPAIRLAHSWANENVKSGFGADITWRRDDVVKQEMRAQPSEIAHLETIIRGMKAKEEVVVVGELFHLDLHEHTFRMQLQDKIIQGTFDKAISSANPAQLPKTYKATLNISQNIVLEENGQEQVEYFLLRLDPPDGQTVFLSDLSERDS